MLRSTKEIADKVPIGKLCLPVAPALYREHICKLRATVLPAESRHSVVHFRLPPPHGDPYDRLPITQARVDDMTPVTRDELIGGYSVPILW